MFAFSVFMCYNNFKDEHLFGFYAFFLEKKEMKICANSVKINTVYLNI